MILVVVETSHVTPGLSPVQQQHIERFQVKASSLLQPQGFFCLSDLHSSSCPAGGDSSVGIKRESETTSCFSVCSSFFTFSGDFSSADEASRHRFKCLSAARERRRLLLRLCVLQPCTRNTSLSTKEMLGERGAFYKLQTHSLFLIHEL